MSYRFCSIDSQRSLSIVYIWKKICLNIEMNIWKTPNHHEMKITANLFCKTNGLYTWIRVLCLNDIDLIFHLISTLEINFRPYVEWLIQIFVELHLYSEFLCKFIGCTCTLSEILHTKTYLCHQYILYEMTQTQY